MPHFTVKEDESAKGKVTESVSALGLEGFSVLTFLSTRGVKAPYNIRSHSLILLIYKSNHFDRIQRPKNSDEQYNIHDTNFSLLGDPWYIRNISTRVY